MQGMIPRWLHKVVFSRLAHMPVVAILGPRQCGKSTLARMYAEARPGMIRLDLERPQDLARLRDPEAFFRANQESLICIDEIQRVPDLFPVMRYVVDLNGRPGQFLVLGSASLDLIKQSSESLAGRISHLELTPFLWSEIQGQSGLNHYWNGGGYPPSFAAPTGQASFEWRLDFVRSFLERDLPALGARIAPLAVERLLRMLCHSHGQLLNMAALGGSLGIDNKTVRAYIDLLEGGFIARRLPPCLPNLKKRLVKSPKIYIRDTGLLHALLSIPDWNTLAGHPVYGASWESLCIENIIPRLRPEVQYGFYRTAAGAEIDLVLETGRDRIALEFKASSAPKPDRGFWHAKEDLAIDRCWIIAPLESGFSAAGVNYATLSGFLGNPDNQDFIRP